MGNEFRVARDQQGVQYVGRETIRLHISAHNIVTVLYNTQYHASNFAVSVSGILLCA